MGEPRQPKSPEFPHGEREEKDGANQIVKPLDKPQWIEAQWPLSTHTIPGYI